MLLLLLATKYKAPLRVTATGLRHLRHSCSIKSTVDVFIGISGFIAPSVVFDLILMKNYKRLLVYNTDNRGVPIKIFAF